MENAIKTVSNIAKTPAFKPIEIRQLMRKLEVDEKSLSILLNVTQQTVQMWLAEIQNPCGSARRLMQILSLAPDVYNRLAQNGGSE